MSCDSRADAAERLGTAARASGNAFPYGGRMALLLGLGSGVGAGLLLLPVALLGPSLIEQVAEAPADRLMLELSAGGIGLLLAAIALWQVWRRPLRRLMGQILPLAAALEQDQRAHLLLDADHRVVLRRPEGDRLFGPPTHPLAPWRNRLGDDPTAVAASEALDRLDLAARQGVPRQEDIAWTTLQGGREIWRLHVLPVPGGGQHWTAQDLGPRRAIEASLHHHAERLADALDFMPVGLYSADSDGRLVWVNARLADWLGRPAKEILGQPIAAVLGDLPSPDEDRNEGRLITPQDPALPVLVQHALFDDSGETLTRSVVIRDWPQERTPDRMQDHLFATIFDDAPLGLAILDAEFGVLQVNSCFAGLVGRRLEEIIGDSLLSCLAPSDQAGIRDHLGRLLQNGARVGPLPVRLATSDRNTAVLLHATLCEDDDDGAARLLLFLLDATERHNLELQFAQSQKMQAMGQLAGGVAHDFNNLLTAMIGFSDLLLQRHAPGDASFADIMQIKQNANRAASLVRQLLAFSRRQALQPRLIDVSEALADLSVLLRRLIGETISLDLIHGRDLGQIRVDPGQFDQVIINLAVNARDAMKRGGTLTITTQRVMRTAPMQCQADIMPPGEYLCIDVRDSGTGIAPEHLSRIFEPFFSTKDVGAGTGLGLSTVYGILRQTGGFIFVESTLGVGTVFHIYLPRIEASPAAAPLPAETRPIPAPDLTGAASLLLVEDEDAVRQFGARALRNNGYQVIEANSAEAALAVLDDPSSPHFDVLITDMVMPGMDGLHLAEQVRARLPGIRVILMSGYSESLALGDAAQGGAVHFLPKPFSLKQLASTVKSVMETPRVG